MVSGWSTQYSALIVWPPVESGSSPREECRQVRQVVECGGRVSLALEQPPDAEGRRSGALVWVYDDDPKLIGCCLR